MVEKGKERRGLGLESVSLEESVVGQRVQLIVLSGGDERDSDDVDAVEDMEHCDEEDEVAGEVHRQKKDACLESGIASSVHGDEDTREAYRGRERDGEG
jgi:hypothetical protein